MTLATKQKIWRAGVLTGFIVLLVSATEPRPLVLAAIGVWFLLLGILQWRWFGGRSLGRS